MINVRELRIGNFIYHNGKIDTLIVVANNDSCTDKYGHGVLDEDLEPIPLTEEKFLNFGFRRDGDEFLLLIENNLWLVFDGEFWFLFDDENHHKIYIPNIIKYVHTLQNFYFYYTGEELQYNG